MPRTVYHNLDHFFKWSSRTAPCRGHCMSDSEEGLPIQEWLLFRKRRCKALLWWRKYNTAKAPQQLNIYRMEGNTGLYPKARSWLSQESTMQNVMSTFPKASELQIETSDLLLLLLFLLLQFRTCCNWFRKTNIQTINSGAEHRQ